MNILLLGAGFSRNWGGWLADELMGELLGRLTADRTLCMRLQRDGAFETTLESVQREARSSPENSHERATLARFEAAIVDAFSDMNRMFADQKTIEFGSRRDGAASVSAFLAMFDAIFTLNQDLLLELLYKPGIVPLERWSDFCFPGVERPSGWLGHALEAPKITQWWCVDESVVPGKHQQPIYKLHGSINWRTREGNQTLVMGGNKQGAISGHPLLARYSETFKQLLFSGQTRLMTIGYGFRDQHINRMLIDATRGAGLQMFLVNPAGLSVLDPPKQGAIAEVSELREIPLCGVVTRPFPNAFTHDRLLLTSLCRIFQEART